MMPLLVLLVTSMSLPYVPLAEEEVVYGVGVKLCNVLCNQKGSCMSFACDIDRLACHLSHKDASHWTMAGSVTYPKKKDQIPGGACSTMNCELNTRCVERRGGGAVCVEDATAGSTLESSCATDSDCSAVRKFVCFAQACKCNPDYSFNPSNNSCVRRGTVSSTLGSSCSTDSDCSAVRKFVCFTKTCKCKPGYSFNPSNNSCVRRCNVYGDGFTTYQGLAIRHNNDIKEHSESVKECSEMCIREKTFTCLTYERRSWSNLCYLSKSGYLDVTPSKRQKNVFLWSLVVRNCA